MIAVFVNWGVLYRTGKKFVLTVNKFVFKEWEKETTIVKRGICFTTYHLLWMKRNKFPGRVLPYVPLCCNAHMIESVHEFHVLREFSHTWHYSGWTGSLDVIAQCKTQTFQVTAHRDYKTQQNQITFRCHYAKGQDCWGECTSHLNEGCVAAFWQFFDGNLSESSRHPWMGHQQKKMYEAEKA